MALVYTELRPHKTCFMWIIGYSHPPHPRLPDFYKFPLLDYTTKTESTGYVISYCIALVG